MKFLGWFVQVLKKGVWVLGFVPALLDYIITYVPTDYIPTFVSNFLEVGATWHQTLVFTLIGLLISAFLVHSQTETKLTEYEYQEPLYELELREVNSEICRSDAHVHVVSTFSMRSLTPWFGYLIRITIGDKGRVTGLENWEVEDIHVDGRLLTNNNLPFSIPQGECKFDVRALAEIKPFTDSQQQKEWEKVMVPVQLLVAYHTQPVGEVSKLLSLDIPVNLAAEFDLVKTQQEKKAAEKTL
jgi:hypothetical protein